MVFYSYVKLPEGIVEMQKICFDGISGLVLWTWTFGLGARVSLCDLSGSMDFSSGKLLHVERSTMQFSGKTHYVIYIYGHFQ